MTRGILGRAAISRLAPGKARTAGARACAPFYRMELGAKWLAGAGGRKPRSARDRHEWAGAAAALRAKAATTGRLYSIQNNEHLSRAFSSQVANHFEVRVPRAPPIGLDTSPLAGWWRSVMQGAVGNSVPLSRIRGGATTDLAAQRRRRLAVGASPRRCCANDPSRAAATATRKSPWIRCHAAAPMSPLRGLIVVWRRLSVG